MHMLTLLSVDEILLPRYVNWSTNFIAQSTGAEEYTDWISTEAQDLPLNKCPGYDTKTSDSEAPALELWGMSSTPLLPLTPGSLRPAVVAPDSARSMG